VALSLPLCHLPAVLSTIRQLATIANGTYSTYQVGEALQQMLPVKERVTEIYLPGAVGEISSPGWISVAQEDLL